MSTWHYADSQQQQRGPVDATWLQAAYGRGEINAATLLWRDGMASWKPLAELAGELGIAVAAPVKLAVMETWIAEERCANHDDEHVGAPASYAKGLLQSITLGDEGDGACTITLAFRDVPSPGDDGVLMLVRQDEGWRYRTSLPERYLPSSIRSQAERLD